MTGSVHPATPGGPLDRGTPAAHRSLEARAGDGVPAVPASHDQWEAVQAVRLEGVGHAYRGRPVLADIDLSIGQGERVALIGPNGAGKSTLLRLIAGVLPAATGRLLLRGDPLADLHRLEIARRLAVVPQEAALPFSARVEEVVALGRLPHEDPFRGPRATDRAAVDAAIERVGIGHLRGRDARELSLGERQLVLVGLAVAQASPVLLLDEPTVHLDLRHQVEVMELLCDLNERDGTTVLAVLHDLSLAAHFFPRLVLLDGGRVIADGHPADVLTAERIRGVFGVDPRLVRIDVHDRGERSGRPGDALPV